jgi:hypothetical protein
LLRLILKKFTTTAKSLYVSRNKDCRVMAFMWINTDHLAVSTLTNTYLTFSLEKLTQNFAAIWMPQH